MIFSGRCIAYKITINISNTNGFVTIKDMSTKTNMDILNTTSFGFLAKIECFLPIIHYILLSIIP